MEWRNRNTYPYPLPYTDEFCHLYAEPLSSFVRATRLFAGAVEHVASQPAGDVTLASQQGLETINLLFRPISAVVERNAKGALEQGWQTGPDFTIIPLSPVEQFVDNESPTQQWQWDVKPNKAGNLHLRLAAVVELKELSKEFETIDREIPVQVDPVDEVSEFWKGNWQWIIATLAALAGTIWKWLQGEKTLCLLQNLEVEFRPYVLSLFPFPAPLLACVHTF